MKTQTIKALRRRLDALGVVHASRKSHYSDSEVLCISDENQPNDVFITDFTFNCQLNHGLLGDLIKWLDDRDAYFECEYPGTFSISLTY